MYNLSTLNIHIRELLKAEKILGSKNKHDKFFFLYRVILSTNKIFCVPKQQNLSRLETNKMRESVFDLSFFPGVG